jgi:hypothetical protein
VLGNRLPVLAGADAQRDPSASTVSVIFEIRSGETSVP